MRATPTTEKPAGQQPAQGETFDRGHELAAGEVAGRAEHDEHRRGRHLVADRLGQRVGSLTGSPAHPVPESRSAFLAERLDELVEGLGERGHALLLEHPTDVAHVDADRRERAP